MNTKSVKSFVKAHKKPIIVSAATAAAIGMFVAVSLAKPDLVRSVKEAVADDSIEIITSADGKSFTIVDVS